MKSTLICISSIFLISNIFSTQPKHYDGYCVAWQNFAEKHGARNLDLWKLRAKVNNFLGREKVLWLDSQFSEYEIIKMLKSDLRAIYEFIEEKKLNIFLVEPGCGDCEDGVKQAKEFYEDTKNAIEFAVDDLLKYRGGLLKPKAQKGISKNRLALFLSNRFSKTASGLFLIYCMLGTVSYVEESIN